MFGNQFFPLAPAEPPKDVPPPTPVNFPRYVPEITANGVNAAGESAKTGPAASPNKKRLTDVLQSIVRPTELSIEHFQALGVRIHENADPTVIIPNYYEHVPDFATWDDIPYDQARDINESTRRPISNGNQSPGILVYLDRKRELSIDNTAAYRTVRRIPQSKASGQPAKLGNAYEFFRHLDNFSSFWDDTSVVPPPAQEDKPVGEAPAEKADSKQASGKQGEESTPMPDAAAPAETPAPEFKAFRTSSGSQMPSEYRLNMTTAFLKLVAYDFGCNVSAPRAEPRLYLNTGSITAEEAELQDKHHKDAQAEAQKAVGQTDGAAASQPASAPAVTAPPTARLPASVKYKGPCSYFTSGCIFVFRSPTTREAARAGFVDGPLAALSARHTTTFPSEESSPGTDRDTCIDLARELVAALVTAQHRAREGRAERRIGKSEWWATKPRWGGGPGGPIGREVDSAPNTDEAPDLSSGEGSGGPPKQAPAVRKPLISAPLMPSSGLPKSPALAAASSFLGTWDAQRMPSKKPRKGMAMYDNYRMVRAPSSSWDKKTRYSAIGRSRGADYDDIFVVSALFHHVSIVRVRVPDRLLAELDGASYEEAAQMAVSEASLRGLHVVRSPWFDLFKTEDRLAGMRLAWGMMAYLMRVDGNGKTDDVPMKDA